MGKILARIVAVTALVSLCMGADSSSCSLNKSSSGSKPSFVADLTLRNSAGEITNSFTRGAPITMVFTIRNRLDTPATVEFTTTRTSDFVVVRENSDTVVWQLSRQNDAAAVTTTKTTLTFAAGEEKPITAVWDQRDNDGNLVRAGTYEARGALVYDGFDNSPLLTNQMASTLKKFTTN